MKVPPGVLQGSHLGPLNDTSSRFFHGKFLGFTDDLIIFSCISTVEDCSDLLSDLNRSIKWCSTNGNEFNASKCKTIWSLGVRNLSLEIIL